MSEQSKEKITILHRFAPINKPEHMDAYLSLFPKEVELRERYGFHTLHANLDIPQMEILCAAVGRRLTGCTLYSRLTIETKRV